MDTSKSYVRDGRIQQKPRGNYFLFSFLFGLALAFVIFVPFMIVDGGRFLFYGDFNVQQVPFYRIAHDAIRSGNIGWNHLTDLGVNFIGSYSFYLLGSPFFWLTIPFPGEWLQYLMGPLFILKFGCALPLWLHLSAPLCKEPQHGALSVSLIRVLGLLDLQHLLQSFSRSHHRVPFALSRAR